ncbi:hypothetical protein AURDEDRAFT_111011 [Auricularia subglabra TFB-10046 SS5]|nr:hypothetical protein AURDEDRAFT_111011 [Auricularia subglabra TFB-10046 SS5]
MKPAVDRTAAARHAARVRVVVYALLLVINAVWASFLVVALGDASLHATGRYHHCVLFLLVSAVLAVLLLTIIAFIDFVNRKRDSGVRSRIQTRVEGVALSIVTFAQYAAATTFTVIFTSGANCPPADAASNTGDGCRFLDVGIRAGSWITPTLVFLYLLYVIVSVLSQSSVAETPDTESQTQPAPTYTLSFFAALERKNTSASGHGSKSLKPPAPAYAYAAAGAIRRLSQTMFNFQGPRRS